MSEVFDGSPPRSWHELDSVLPVEIIPVQDGRAGSFFSRDVPVSIGHLELLNMAKSDDPADAMIWRLGGALGVLTDDLEPDTAAQLATAISAAQTIYEHEYTTYRGSLKDTVKQRQTELRQATKPFQSGGLLRAAMQMTENFPSDRNREVEGIIRLLILHELSTSRESAETA